MPLPAFTKCPMMREGQVFMPTMPSLKVFATAWKAVISMCSPCRTALGKVLFRRLDPKEGVAICSCNG